MNYSMAAKVHLFSAHFPSNWDGNQFVQNLIRFASDGRSKCPIAMSLNPMAPQVLSAKYELLNERIWKLAVMSVSSGESLHFEKFIQDSRCSIGNASQIATYSQLYIQWGGNANKNDV